MRLSAFQLAVASSVLLHSLAFSVVCAIRTGHGIGVTHASIGADRVLEITTPETVVPDVPATPIKVASTPVVLPAQPAAAVVAKKEAVSPLEELPQEWFELAMPERTEVHSEVNHALQAAAQALPVASVSPASTEVSGGAGESLAVSEGEESSSRVSYLSNPKPPYPRQARLRKEQGIVLLGVSVTVEGVPDEVRVKRSSSYVLLDEAALRAVRQWRFVPARKGEKAVPSQIEGPVRFDIAK